MRAEIATANIGIYSLSDVSVRPIPHYTFDLHQFRDPMNTFRTKSGRDKEVQEWIRSDPRLPVILQQGYLLAQDLITGSRTSWLTIGFKDFHGKWISAAVAEIAANYLEDKGYKVWVGHHYDPKENYYQGQTERHT